MELDLCNADFKAVYSLSPSEFKVFISSCNEKALWLSKQL